jgi:hypothetical protein
MEIRRVNAHIQFTANMTQLQILPGLVAGYSTVKAPTKRRGKIAIQSKLDYLWRMERESPAPQSPKLQGPSRPGMTGNVALGCRYLLPFALYLIQIGSMSRRQSRICHKMTQGRAGYHMFMRLGVDLQSMCDTS